jgi:hypothetical protein
MKGATYLRGAILISALAVAGALAKPPKGDVMVWALPDAKVYHCPGSKLYRIGKGKEMSECQAIRERYRPALLSCGSGCQ